MPKLKPWLSGVRPGDLAIVATVVIFAVISGFYVYGGAGQKLRVVIESPHGSWVYSLEETLTLEIPGSIGITRINIKNKEVKFDASPCPNKTCIAAPPLSRKGDWNACLPNEVIARIEGSDQNKDDIDAIAR